MSRSWRRQEEMEAAIERTERLIQRGGELERISLRVMRMLPELEHTERLIRSLNALSHHNPALWAMMTGARVLGGIAGAYETMYRQAEEEAGLNRRALDEQHRRGVPP